jgi:hypothetical protein
MSENAWGFTKKDLADHGVQLMIDVNFTWTKDCPDDLKQRLGEAAQVLHKIAEDACMLQLKVDGLGPNKKRDVLYGDTPKGRTVIRETDWTRP